MKRERLTAEAWLLTVTLIWGGTFPILKTLVSSVAPYTLVAVRFAAAALFLGFLGRSKLKTLNRRAVGFGWLMGFFLWAAYALQTVGLVYTTASKAGFITGLFVVLVPVFARLFFGKATAPSAWIGVLAAALGLALLSLDFSSETPFNLGDLLVFFCAVAYAIQVVLVDRYSSELDPTLMAWIQVSFVAVASSVLAIVFDPRPEGLSSPGFWAGVLYLSALATALAFYVQMKYQKDTTPARAAIIFTMEPVFGAFLSALFLGETMSGQAVLGGALVVGGILVSEIGALAFRRSPSSGSTG